MENEIFISNRVAGTLDSMSDEQREQAALLIDALKQREDSNLPGDHSFITSDGELQMATQGDVSLLFTYSKAKHNIIVTDLAKGKYGDTHGESTNSLEIRPARFLVESLS